MRLPAWCSRGVIAVLTAAVLCLVGACNTGPDLDPGPSAAPADGFAAITGTVQKRLDSDDPSLAATRAVLVDVDGRTVVSVYRELRPTDNAHVFSVTKSVMSLLVGIAIDDGLLSLDQTVVELLPDHADRMSERVQAVTLQQLLTMTAGVEPGRNSFDSGDVVDQILGFSFEGEPGLEWSYSNDGAHLIGAILQEAVDQPLLDYARAKLFDPLDIDTRPAWQGSEAIGVSPPGFGWGADRDGINSGCCLLKLTAPDMIKIGRLALDHGRWRGRQLVSAAWIEESAVDQLTAEQNPFDYGSGYGYLWWTGLIHGYDTFAAQGAHGQLIVVVPERRIVIATVVDETGPQEPTERFFSMLEDDIIQSIIRG